MAGLTSSDRGIRAAMTLATDDLLSTTSHTSLLVYTSSSLTILQTHLEAQINIALKRACRLTSRRRLDL